MPIGIPVPIIVVLALICFLLVFIRRAPSRDIGFRVTDYGAKPLLSGWEIAALTELRRDMPAGFYACPQVRLADLLTVGTSDRSRFRAALNRVAAKSVDFAIIDERGRVALVIELDDKSHNRQDRQQRDTEVNAVLRQSRIPVLRVKPRTKLNLRAHLAPAIATAR